SVTQITAVAPARASAATVEVTVTGTGGTNATAGTGNDYTYYAVPTITAGGLSPSSGPSAGGTPVVITGTGLLGATAVRFGATNATSFTVDSSTQITAISPSGMANSGITVTVVTPGGTSNAVAYGTGATVRPTVGSLSVTTGPTSGGTALTVTGTNFTVNMSFTFTIGAVAYAATSVVVGSSTSATLVTPAVVATGTAAVSATNSSAASQTNGTFSYTAPVPTVTSLSPTTGPTSGGTSVTITGTGFITGATVKFGSLSATGVVVNSPTSITVVSPATVTPGTVSVVVTTSGGDSTPAGALGAAADDFVYTAPVPTVTSISPTSGPTSGGTTVTITGTGFVTGATVAFDGLAPVAATVVSATSLTVVSPSTVTPGVVDLQVTTSGGSSSTTGAGDNFTYTAPVPSVSSLSPSTGPVTGGTSVTVTGTGFVTGASVTVGGLAVPAASVTVVSATSITIVTPATVAVGVANVQVTTSGGSSSTAGSGDDFTYASVTPTVTSLSPSSGPVTGGTEVAIAGTGFVTGATVKFGSLTASVVSVTPTLVTVMSPATVSVTTVQVTVTTSGGASVPAGAQGAAADDFTYTLVAPQVTSLSPATGPTSGGTTVLVNGSGFITGATVTFGSLSATVVSITPTVITVTSPATVTVSTVDVQVSTDGGDSITTNLGDNFAYTAPVPTVTGLDPLVGPVTGNTLVTITGTGFVTGATVTVNGIAATSVSVTSPTTITMRTPASTVTGAVNVQVTTAVGNSSSTTGNGDAFTYQATLPTVASMDVLTGPVSGGTAVTITGTGFVANATVWFGTRQAGNVVVVSPTSITATSPAALALDAVPVTVITTGGTSAVTELTPSFTYTSVAPVVTGLTPATGSSAGGQTVVVNGTGFLSDSTVTFGSAPATVVTVTPIAITVTTPATTFVGPVSVEVSTTSGGPSDTAGSADDFTYVAAVPAVTGLDVRTGPVTGGTAVTITGTGFVTGATVTLNGVAATGVSVSSPTTLTMTTPASTVAGTVNVQVTNEVGKSSSTSGNADDFTYEATLPTVSAIAPASGSVSGGTTVTVTGTGFIANATVKFGTISGTNVSVTSPTTLTVTSPPTLTLGAVSVEVSTTGGQSDTSGLGDDFTYTSTVPTVTSINPLTGSTAGGETITVNGTGFTSSATVTVGGVAATVLTRTPTAITVTTPATTQPGKVDVQVTTSPGGQSDITGTGDDFTYVAPVPTVTQVSPNSGPTSGGTPVTITGTGFVANASVKFGGAVATDIVVVSPTQITATSPATSTVGTVSVQVITTGGPSVTTSQDDDFTYALTTPTVTSVSPISGPSTGSLVTVNGTGFITGISVAFGGAAGTNVTLISPTQLTVTAPATKVLGKVDVQVTTDGGSSATGGTSDDYTYTAVVPTVTALDPAYGSIAGGTSVTVTGTGFVEGATVSFNGTAAAAADVTVSSPTSLTVITPPHPLGVVDVTVATSAGTSSTAGVGNDFTFAGKPTVTGLSATAGPLAGGDTITVTGSGFVRGATVSFGTTPGTSVNVVSGTELTVVVPARAAGTIDVTVTTGAGTSDVSDASKYRYVAVPTIASISPASGPLAAGTLITIIGTNFVGVTAVTFDGVSGTDLNVTSETTLQVKAPARATAGSIDVVLTAVGGAVTRTNGYRYFALPSVVSVSPVSGPLSAGTLVTVSGSNLDGAVSVTFGGVAGTSLSVVSDSELSVRAPAALVSGGVAVVVSTPGGVSSGSVVFTYVDAPVVSGVSPGAGPVAGGGSVTISGSFLSGASAVSFGSVPASSFTVVSASEISAVVPAGSVGSVAVRVTTAGGQSADTAADDYRYFGVPSVSGLSPASGPVAGGQVVAVSGANLLGATSVTFDGVPVAFSVKSDSSVEATAPAGVVGTVQVRVVTPGGTSSADGTGNDYRYFAVPTITTITPAVGPIAGGTSVTITGTNLDGVTAVAFDSAQATNIVVVSDTQITLTTPSHVVGTASITLTTPGGSASLSAGFRYFGVPVVSGVSPRVLPLSGGSVTVSGSNLDGVSKVVVGSVEVTSFASVSDSAITLVVPGVAAAVSGVSVSVVTPGGTSDASGTADDVRFVAAPVVSGVSPNRGPVAG
ncbi:MAG: IPT/TIG domain-containing protein, partial [Ilumatobacteraceae bacterium]